jgi:hypothetical protein
MTTDRRKYAERRSAARRESRHHAIERLAEKQVTPAYRAPRGNPDVDRDAMNYALAGLDRVVA